MFGVRDMVIRLDGDDLIRAWRKVNMAHLKDDVFRKWYTNELEPELKDKLYKALKGNVDLAVHGKEKE
jgi:hypothetical protein